MKISDLIERLNRVMETEGDIEVSIQDYSEWEASFMDDYTSELDDDYIYAVPVDSISVSNHRWDNGKVLKLLKK